MLCFLGLKYFFGVVFCLTHTGWLNFNTDLGLMFLLWSMGLSRKKEKLKQRRVGCYKNHSFCVFDFPRAYRKKKGKKKVNLIFASFSHCRNQEQVWIFQFVCTSSPHFNEQHGLSLSFFFFPLKLNEYPNHTGSVKGITHKHLASLLPTF